MSQKCPNGILIEAESFSDYGGWTLDSQWELEMGSPYLMAHGKGKPVTDAMTGINIATEGTYNVWVRSKDWVPGHHPGRFTLLVNGKSLPVEFGANDKTWNWESGGQIKLPAGKARLALHDLTGFNGRCDAIFLSTEDIVPPNENDAASRAWRKSLLGIPGTPELCSPFDVVVIGGGIPGSTAALAAARLGLRVAFIQNRPVLGGNGSIEAGLRPRGVKGPFIEEVAERHANGDLLAKQILEAHANVQVFLEHTVYDAFIKDTNIQHVDARHARSGREVRITAPTFIDASGRALFVLLAGAEALSGRESQAEFGESLAAPRRDYTHHGNTVFFRTKFTATTSKFPAVPWATEVARDFARLEGQLVRPGLDNGEGPVAVAAPDSTTELMKKPLTHYWEYGQHLDMYTQGEHIRDHLLRAIYGTFSNVKTIKPEKFANLELEHVAFVSATGEFARYKGDHILTENDVRNHVPFHDAVVFNDGAFCLHYPGDEKLDFRLKHWVYDERDHKPYAIPFRCLYSANISNLMMAGKHISTTHVAGASTKFMGNGAQHGIGAACAASLCQKYGTTPKGLYQSHLEELKALCKQVTETGGKKLSSKL